MPVVLSARYTFGMPRAPLGIYFPALEGVKCCVTERSHNNVKSVTNEGELKNRPKSVT